VLQKVCRGQKAARRVVRRAAVAVAPRYRRYAGRPPGRSPPTRMRRPASGGCRAGPRRRNGARGTSLQIAKIQVSSRSRGRTSYPAASCPSTAVAVAAECCAWVR